MSTDAAGSPIVYTSIGGATTAVAGRNTALVWHRAVRVRVALFLLVVEIVVVNVFLVISLARQPAVRIALSNDGRKIRRHLNDGFRHKVPRQIPSSPSVHGRRGALCCRRRGLHPDVYKALTSGRKVRGMMRLFIFRLSLLLTGTGVSLAVVVISASVHVAEGGRNIDTVRERSALVVLFLLPRRAEAWTGRWRYDIRRCGAP